MWLAALLGGLAVALGAFGAHGLKSGLLAEAPDAALRLGWWETGVRYQMWHALLLFAAAMGPHATWHSPSAPTSPDQRTGRTLTWLAVFIGAGTLLFSGSLYLMALTGVRILGAITPFGGVAFLLAWGLLTRAGLRARRRRSPPASR